MYPRPQTRFADMKQERRIDSLKTQRLQLLGAACDVDEQHAHAVGQTFQDGMSGAKAFQRGYVDDHVPARTQRFPGGFEQARYLMPTAADENRIGGWQIREHIRGDAVDGVEIRDAKRLGVGQNQVIISGVLFDGVDGTRIAQPRRLDGYRAGAGADVPDNAGRLNRHLRQGDAAHLSLCDEAALGPTLREHVIRITEWPKSRYRCGAIRPARLALENDDVERSKLHVLKITQFALRDTFIGAAEVLADIHAEIVESARQQGAGNLRWPLFLAGE